MNRLDQDRSVAKDMAALFDGVVPTRSGTSVGALVVTGGGAARSRGANRWLVATAPLVIGLLTIGLYFRPAETTSAPRPRPRPPSTVAVGAIPAETTVPVARQAVPQSGETDEELAEAGVPMPVVGHPRSPEPASRGVSPASPMLPAPAPARTTGLAQPVAVAATARKPTPAAAVRPLPATVAAAAGCRPGDDGDDCIFQEVVAADRRLRAAYDGAAGAGAPPRSLAAINRRWQQARSLATDDPDETIRRYRALARELDDLRVLDQ